MVIATCYCTHRLNPSKTDAGHDPSYPHSCQNDGCDCSQYRHQKGEA